MAKKETLKELDEKDGGTDSLWNDVMDFSSRYVRFADDLIPAPLMSIGATIANQRQAKEPFFYVDGIPEDIRLSIAFVAPSGLSKSFAMKLFVNKFYGICPIKCAFRGKITEAGYVGTLKDGEEIRGDAWHYNAGILAFNEISNLFMTAQQEHSAELVNQVMESLSEGYVTKRLGTGTIEYETQVTIWGATQPKRFDFSQGLARRFLFVARNWTQKDLETLKDCRMNAKLENGKTKKVDVDEAKSIKERLQQCKDAFKATEVEWKGDIHKFIKDNTESHLQMTILEHAILGKTVIEKPSDSILEIDDSEYNRGLLKQMITMQNMVSEGSDVALLISVLQELGGEATRGQLWDRFKKFSYTLENFITLLESCIRLGVFVRPYKQKGESKYKKKRGL
jgi:hypothetical protein